MTKGSRDLFKYQQEFVEWLVALDERRGSEAPVGAFVKQQFLHRLEAYQGSYLGRVTSNLSTTLFEVCEKIFDKDFVQQVLAAYFKEHPPTADILTNAAGGLPAFLRAQQSTREALLFADLVDVSLLRWNVLTGHDPVLVAPKSTSPLSEVYLVGASAYVPASGQHDLFAAWGCSADACEAGIPECVFEAQVGVLIAKPSPLEFSLVAVPGPLHLLAEILVNGGSVEDAVNGLAADDAANEEQLPQLLQIFLSKLTSSGLMTLVVS
jgi:hypothetical protein